VTCTSETNTLNSGSVTSRMRVNKTTLYVKKNTETRQVNTASTAYQEQRT